ncbi:hypothetical protein AMTRI_Chr04g245030 [Amborella trichopoda]
MHVGQMLECSLGFAGDPLNRHYRITPFDERYEQENSRCLFYMKSETKHHIHDYFIHTTSYKKDRIFDGRTRFHCEQPIILGKPYVLKLIHQVDYKIYVHSNGHYALGDKEQEKDLEGFGVTHIFQEMIAYKSNHIKACQEVLTL